MSNSKALSNRHGSAVITLPKDNEILITREFDAPAALIFKAYTTPELVKRWWGFESSEWVVCEIDLRVGGRWRYVTRDEGFEVGFHGEYKEIEAPNRLVSTEVYEGDYEGKEEGGPEPGTLNIMTLAEAAGVTTMEVLVQAESQEVRDAIIASGMEGGLQVSYDRLEEVVRDLA